MIKVTSGQVTPGYTIQLTDWSRHIHVVVLRKYQIELTKNLSSF